MSKIKVVEYLYGKLKGFYVQHKKERVSGPWKTKEAALEAKQEWLVGGIGEILADYRKKPYISQ